MKKLLPAIVFSILLLVPVGAQNAFAQGDLYGCSVTTGPFSSGQLYVLDESNGSTISNQDISLGGSDVGGCNGLATHPNTGDVWIIVKQSGNRILGTINTGNGVVTSVGVLSDNFAGIAFDPAGTLYGVTGDGAAVPETLYTLDQSDASSTFFLALGNGDDGETIAIDNECVLYHGSGISNGDRFYERIDLVTKNTIFSGQQSGPAIDDELVSMTFNPSTLRVLASERFAGGDIDFLDFTAAGVATDLGNLDTNMKGLAFEEPFAGLATDEDCDGDLDLMSVGGSFVPIDGVSLLVASTQVTAAWLIPVLVSAVGIGLVFVRKN